jgi:hypothetical protein
MSTRREIPVITKRGNENTKRTTGKKNGCVGRDALETAVDGNFEHGKGFMRRGFWE